MLGCGREWPVELDAVAQRGGRVVDDACADAVVDEMQRLSRHAFGVEGERKDVVRGRVVTNGDQLAHQLLVHAHEAAVLLSRQRAEADPAEMFKEVGDRVRRKHHLELAGVDCGGALVALARVDHLGGESVDVERVDVSGVTRRVAATVVAARDADEARLRRRRGTPHTGSGDDCGRPRAGTQRAVRVDVVRSGCTGDDRHETSALFRCRRCCCRRERDRPAGAEIGRGQWRDVRARGDAPALFRRLQCALDRILIETAHLADTDAAVVDQAHTYGAGSLGDALMNLVAGEPRQLARVIDDDDFGIAALQTRERCVADCEQLVVAAHRAGSTFTLRKRQGAAP